MIFSAQVQVFLVLILLEQDCRIVLKIHSPQRTTSDRSSAAGGTLSLKYCDHKSDLLLIFFTIWTEETKSLSHTILQVRADMKHLALSLHVCIVFSIQCSSTGEAAVNDGGEYWIVQTWLTRNSHPQCIQLSINFLLRVKQTSDFLL